MKVRETSIECRALTTLGLVDQANGERVEIGFLTDIPWRIVVAIYPLPYSQRGERVAWREKRSNWCLYKVVYANNL